MITKPINISIPMLWGQENFIKSEWGYINYIVGANGTGKSLLAEQIKNNFNNGGFMPRYLNAERLTGFEKNSVGHYGGGNLAQGFNISQFQNLKNTAESSGLSSSAIIILKERLDIRIKIEALLSDMFGKTIRLAEEGGFLKPVMQRISGGGEYNLSQSECHGLKELITLLTFLYDTSKNCIIFDEPELHLHPQFQSFFLSEIRKVAGNPLEDPSKKLFFIITHSPYFLEIKTLDELKNILVCHLDKAPTYVSTLDENDSYVLKRFLPRFNTHHKQFFFSPNPVFVEGYTDQQIISILFEKLGISVGASGSCIIDVGGKDELGVFYKLCKSLKINCRIIADLDALFRGKLREVVSEDERSNQYVQEKGIGADLSKGIGELETHLSSIATSLISSDSKDADIVHLKDILSAFKSDEEHRKRVSMLLGIMKFEIKIRPLLSGVTLANFNLALGRINQIFYAFKTCNTYILPKGEIEHYYTQSNVDYLDISNKDNFFHAERDYLLQIESAADINAQYIELLVQIKSAVPVVEIEIKKHLKFEIFEWVHRVQTGIAKKEVNNAEDLKINNKVNYVLYSQILDLEELVISDDRTFKCRIKVKSLLDDTQPTIEFDQATNAHSFSM
ncbi:MAG: TOPRIM nucleotidyl transferase/hydrolase domain-containing protein [Gallionellaceae bacterium]